MGFLSRISGKDAAKASKKERRRQLALEERAQTLAEKQFDRQVKEDAFRRATTEEARRFNRGILAEERRFRRDLVDRLIHNVGSEQVTASQFARIKDQTIAQVRSQFENISAQEDRRLRALGVNPASGRGLADARQREIEQAAAVSGQLNDVTSKVDIFNREQRQGERNMRQKALGLGLATPVIGPQFIKPDVATAYDPRIGLSQRQADNAGRNARADAELSRAQFADTIGAVAKIGGTAAGFALGGPAGAVVGEQLGSQLDPSGASGNLSKDFTPFGQGVNDSAGLSIFSKQ